MDVERLMKDLSVEQLDNIHGSLQTEMEGKKEELRDMVGRRYRDVLEASVEVRHVRQLSETLTEAVSKARNTQGTADMKPTVRGQQRSIQLFIALHRLLPMIGDEDGDAISDAFSLVLAENIQKQLSSEHIPHTMQTTVSSLSSRLNRLRKSLTVDLELELGELSNTEWVSNQLIALAILKNCDLECLLNLYLNARENFVSNQLEDSSSLIFIVNELKSTLIAVEQLFAHGDITRYLQTIGSSGYRPQIIENMIDDQAFSFAKVINVEIEKINRQQRERKNGQLLTQRINDLCTSWTEKVCGHARSSVVTIADFYEKTDDVIEFLQALSAILRENWPRIISNTVLYQYLFGNIVLDRFKSLVDNCLSTLFDELVSRLDVINTAPHHLFEKRAGRFDPLLGVGLSQSLNDCVCSFYDGVSQIREACVRYEKIGMEKDVDSLKSALADGLVNIIQRLCQHNGSIQDGPSALSKTRLCLGLLHCNRAVVCQTLNKDGDRISKTSALLHKTTEESLSHFCCATASECLSQAVLHDYSEACTSHVSSIALATEWEKVDLAEVGTVEAPICLSSSIHSALFSLNKRLGDASVAHLLSRSVRKGISQEVSSLLSHLMETTISRCNVVQRTWIQLLFDCRLLNSLFPNEKFKKLQSEIESHIDPFDLSLLSNLLSTNIRLASQRYQLLFSCLLVDVLPNRDTQPSATYTQVVDVVPKAEQPMRVSLIPRLDRNPTEEVSKRIQAAKTPKNKFLATPQAASKNTSLGSLYDKVSGFSFFGN